MPCVLLKRVASLSCGGMSLGQEDHEVQGGPELADAGAGGMDVVWWRGVMVIVLALALSACSREPQAPPEQMLVGVETVKPLAKEDLDLLHDVDPKAPESAVLAPLSAVVGRRGAAADDPSPLAVFRVEANGRAKEVPIEGHLLQRNDLVVVRGLEAGAKIVVQGAGSLYDGAPVTARPAWPLQGASAQPEAPKLPNITP